jgi:hypothetical protein
LTAPGSTTARGLGLSFVGVIAIAHDAGYRERAAAGWSTIEVHSPLIPFARPR